MSYQNGPRIVTNGLALYLDAANTKSYPLTGSFWNDLSGNNHNFQLHNGATFVNNGSRSSILFDGVDDNVGAATYTNLQLKNDKTLIFWFNHYNSSADTQGALIRTGLGADLLYCLFANKSSRVLQFHWYNNNFLTINSTSTYTLDTFNFGGISIIGTSGIFYINGQIAGSGTVSVPSPTSASLIGIGATRSGAAIGTTSQDFGGQIAIVKIYNRGLTSIEMLQNYNALKGRFNL